MTTKTNNENLSPDPATPKTASSAERQPNIKYVGRPRWDKGKRKRLDYNAPIESFSDRGRIVELPSPSVQERQRKFYHEDAGQIVRLFPFLYKRLIQRSK